MIKDWIVNSSEGLDSASKPGAEETFLKASPQEPTDPQAQVSLLGLEVSSSEGFPAIRNLRTNQPGPVSPFSFLDAIPPFDLSNLEYPSIDTIPQLSFDPLASLSLANPDTAIGVAPSSIAQPFPPISQDVFPQKPSNGAANEAQAGAVPRRLNALSSILIGSDVPSKCESVRSTYMNVPRSTSSKRSDRGKCKGSQKSLPLSGSGANKRRNLPSSYSSLLDSNGTSTEEQIPFSLDSISNVSTATFPASDTPFVNFPILSPSLNSTLSLPSYIINGPFDNPQPAQSSSSLGMDSMSHAPGYLGLLAPANQFGYPTAWPLSTSSTSLQPFKATPDAPLVNIENRPILKRTSTLISAPKCDTENHFVYEHRANPIRNRRDAIRIMFGAHPLTRGERATIECIYREQEELIMERQIDSDAAGATRRQRR
jgi:hypothetical protein